MDPEGIGIEEASRNEPFQPTMVTEIPLHGWPSMAMCLSVSRHHQSVVAPAQRTLVSVPIKEVWRGSLALGLGQPLCWRR